MRRTTQSSRLISVLGSMCGYSGLPPGQVLRLVVPGPDWEAWHWSA